MQILEGAGHIELMLDLERLTLDDAIVADLLRLVTHLDEFRVVLADRHLHLGEVPKLVAQQQVAQLHEHPRFQDLLRASLLDPVDLHLFPAGAASDTREGLLELEHLGLGWREHYVAARFRMQPLVCDALQREFTHRDPDGLREAHREFALAAVDAGDRDGAMAHRER